VDTAQFKLGLLPSSGESQVSNSVTWGYGLVVRFGTGFTERFCKPVHLTQATLTFKEPIALCAREVNSERVDKGKVGTESYPARAIAAASQRHRSMDIS
jgi:protein arginine N-methyltransferase 3